MVLLTGLSQKYLGSKLEISPKAPGKGTILEVKEERGLGTTVDVILYEGRIKRGESIALGGKHGAIFTTVRAILKPRPLDEIRDPKYRFNHIPEVHAASGIKIAAPRIEDALAGSQLYVYEPGDEQRVKADIEKEKEGIAIETEDVGLVVKTDTVGALEAMVKILGENSIPIRIANVGDISKRDVIEAAAVKEKDRSRSVVLGFNVDVLPDAAARSAELDVQIIKNNIIYKIIEDYEEWVKKLRDIEKKEELDMLVRPAKIRIIPGTVFRQNKPAIVGIEVIEGVIKPRVELLNISGATVGVVKELQDKGEAIGKATKGREVAAAIEGPTVGRQIKEGDIILSAVPESHARLLLDKYAQEITTGELEVLEELKTLMRKTNPLWGM